MLRNSWGKANERQLLGLPSVAVTFGSNSTETTKKEVLKSLASVFDTLGVASPRRLVGKMIYIEGCEQHLQWDAVLPETAGNNRKSSRKACLMKSKFSAEEPFQGIDSHMFGNTNGTGMVALLQ